MNLETFEYSSYLNLAEQMIADLKNADDLDYVQAVGRYDFVQGLLDALIKCNDGMVIQNIELTTSEWDGYEKEFYISLSRDGINVEKAYNKEADRYLNSEGASITYISEDANYGIVRHIFGDKKIVKEGTCDDKTTNKETNGDSVVHCSTEDSNFCETLDILKSLLDIIDCL